MKKKKDEDYYWYWNWIDGGWNYCKASSREEALQKAKMMCESCSLAIDEKTLREVPASFIRRISSYD